MPEFQYKAKDSAGRKKNGKVSATSKKQAKEQLKRMKLKVVDIKATKLDKDTGGGSQRDYILGKILYKDKNGAIQISMGEQKPTTKDLVIFTKQFATMIESGVPLVQSVGLLADQQRIEDFGDTLHRIRHAVENGATLSESMEAVPKIFDSLYVSMVRAGESSGNLDTILKKLVIYIEKASKIKSQVKGAMMYPAIVLVVAAAVIIGMLTFVIPQFAAQYAGKENGLPWITQALIDMSEWVQVNWHLLGGSIVGVGLGFKFWIDTESGRAQFDKYILKFPVIGMLLQKIAVSRFCNTMGTMLVSGVNLLESLSICAAASGNKTIEAFVMNTRSRIEQGDKLSEPLGEGTLFPPMVVSMIAVGEETGKLDDMLEKISEFYEDEVDLAVKTMLSMLEPIMIVGIGGVIAVMVIAMYLPMFSMAS